MNEGENRMFCVLGSLPTHQLIGEVKAHGIGQVVIDLIAECVLLAVFAQQALAFRGLFGAFERGGAVRGGRDALHDAERAVGACGRD